MLHKASNPVRLFLFLGSYCERRIRSNCDGSQEDRSAWIDLNEDIEKEAVNLIDRFGKRCTVFDGIMTNSDIRQAQEIGWKRVSCLFLALIFKLASL